VAKVDGRQRAVWGTLTREQVVRAAERWVRAGRYDQLTIRGLAAELEVSPMALYRHVRDKDDLIDEVVDRMLARRWRPRTSRDDWMAWTKEAAERLRSFLVSEPAALHVYLQHPVVSPSAITRMEAMLDVLASAGIDTSGTRDAYATIHTYTIGFAAVEASRARAVKQSGDGSAIEQQLKSFTTPQQFIRGLEYLLEGIDRRRNAPTH
jgi:AcrR family transcriptional regulator